MAMLVLALILVICSQVAKPLKITVPEEFNGVQGKCDLALAEMHKLKLEKPLVEKGTIKACAAACGGSDDCASFHFTGQYKGGDQGECAYSSFICIGDSLITPAKDSKTYRVYITKGTGAWTKSADGYIIAETQRRTFLNQTIYYTEGCCTKDSDKYCAGDKGEAEEAEKQISHRTECYNSCVNNTACASFRIKWHVPENDEDETGICFTSQHACSFTANNQTGRVNDNSSEALSYFLVERLKGAQMIAGKGEIDVGGSGRAAAAILVVTLAAGILTLATKSIG